MKALKPKGFKLIAVTAKTGTGGVEAKAYFSPDAKKVWFVILDPITDMELPFGPIDTRCLETFAITIADVREMSGKPVSYLKEEDD